MTIRCLRPNNSIYEGTVERSNGEIYQDYRFYDEREWRFVPDRKAFDEVNSSYDPVLNKDLFDLYKRTSIETGNRFLNGILLRFNLSDVNGIYVESNKDIEVVIQYLSQMKCNIDMSELRSKLKLWK